MSKIHRWKEIILTASEVNKMENKCTRVRLKNVKTPHRKFQAMVASTGGPTNIVNTNYSNLM